jgi:hypothetical protein
MNMFDNAWQLPDETERNAYFRHLGIIQVGDIIEVVKGKKYPHGTRGIVTFVYEYQRPNGSGFVTYCLTDNGMKVAAKNVKIAG